MLSDRLPDLPTENIFNNEEVGVGVDRGDASTLVLLPKQNAVLDLGRNLLKAARQGNTAQVHDLMTKGAPFTTDWLGTSALHLAALNNHLETCEVLLRAGISKDSRTKVERTPLHLAAYEGHDKIVELLLNNKAEVDPLDMLRMTPLHWAVEKQHEACIELLLAHGADSNLLSKFDKTPVTIALEIQRLDLVNLLNEADKIYPEREMLFREEASVEQADATITATESISYALQSEIEPEDESNVVNENGVAVADHSAVDLTETNETHKEIIVEPDILQEHDFDNNNMEDLVTATKLSDSKGSTSASHISALRILQSHGITMLPADDGELINNAIQSGRTIVLSEAGKMMLAESKNKPTIKVEPIRQKVLIHPNFKTKRMIRLTPEQILAMTNSSSSQKPNILKKVSAEAFKKAAQNSGVNLSSITSPFKIQTKPKLTYINSKDRGIISFSKNLTSPSKNNILNKDRPEVHNVQQKLDEALRRVKELETQLELKDKENKKLCNQIESLLKSRGSSHGEII